VALQIIRGFLQGLLQQFFRLVHFGWVQGIKPAQADHGLVILRVQLKRLFEGFLGLFFILAVKLASPSQYWAKEESGARRTVSWNDFKASSNFFSAKNA
jgi:hypothetical protein